MDTKAMEVAGEKEVEKAITEFKPNPAFASAGALLPKSYKEVMELATIACKSGMVPKDMTGRPEAAALAIMFGLEVGISPAQALQNIMVVNGRPSLWGDLVKALIMGSNKCELFDEDPAHKALAQGYGRCRLKRKGGGEVEVQFSKDDAVRAKLWTKQGPWQDYPGRMLQMRARSWACRDLFPDVLKGMQIREEIGDMEIFTPTPVTPMPARVKTLQNAQEATIVTGSTQTPNPAQNGEPTPQNGGNQANAAEVGDAQEPVADPEVKIDEVRRKDLFKKWTAKKIPTSEVKAYCKEEFDLEYTAELTNQQGDILDGWIGAWNPK